MASGNIPFGPAENSRISTPPAGMPDAARRTPQCASGRLRQTCYVLGVCILLSAGLIACLLASFWFRSQGAVQVVQAQVEAIRKGNLEEAYTLFSSRYQAGVSLPMFRRWVRHEGRLDKVNRLQFWGRSVWGTKAVLWGSFQDDLGHSFPVTYLLTRENGFWRIAGFHLSAKPPDSVPGTTRFIEI